MVHWGAAVRAVQRRYPEARVVAPSHGDPGGVALLSHTVELAESR